MRIRELITKLLQVSDLDYKVYVRKDDGSIADVEFEIPRFFSGQNFIIFEPIELKRA